MTNNIILKADSYKASHFLQYPPGTKRVASYIEARGGGDETVFFGLQPYLKDLARGITKEDVLEAKEIFTPHGVPFNEAGWMYIVDSLGGKIPVQIQALPEGMVVPVGTPLVQLMNTSSELPWLTSYLETSLLRAVWYPTTVATISRKAKKIIKLWLKKNADDPDTEINFKLHDFGARGVSSSESAALGGMAHLVNFMGTDTIEGLVAATRHYGTGKETFGFSIPAAEHSTITSWGRAREVEAYRNMLKQFAKPNSLVAVLSDSYDIYEACSKMWGEELKQEIIDSGATVVIRPDSGNPREVVLKVLEILKSKFGGTLNSKGYFVLPSYVRVIQGDGVNLTSINEILMHMDAAGYSASNIAFGMGGALLQKCDRDTFKFAMKACAIEDENGWRDVYKDPVTDSGKRSKRGIQHVYNMLDGLLVTTSPALDMTNLLENVFIDGEVTRNETFENVRMRANQNV